MVSAARLDWLLSELNAGRQCKCHMNTHAGKFTIRFTLTTQYDAATINLAPICLIQSLKHCLGQFVVVDHGHGNSAGDSHCSFVFKTLHAPAPTSSVPHGASYKNEGKDSTQIGLVQRIDEFQDDSILAAQRGNGNNPKRIRLDDYLSPPSQTELEWFSLAETECRTFNKWWKLSDDVRMARHENRYDDANSLVYAAFSDQIAALGGNYYRPGAHLSWKELESRGFRRSVLYDFLCDKLHDGSKDPRAKTDEFLSLYNEMSQFG